MKDFFRQNGLLLLLIAVLLSILLAVVGTFLGGSADPLSDFFSILTTPVRTAASAVAHWGEGVYNYVVNYDDLYQELDDLHTQVAEMEEQVRQAQDALRENEELRELLNLQEKRRDFTFASARVTAPETSNWHSTLTISKGSSSGVEAGDCVINARGELVGVVSTVGTNSAEVATLIDLDTDIGGMVARTYSAGVLEGDFALMEQGKLRLNYLPDGAQLIAGDEVLTSGRGGVYPSGLVVGQVEGVFDDPSGATRYAVVNPAADLDSLFQVFVILDFDIVE